MRRRSFWKLDLTVVIVIGLDTLVTYVVLFMIDPLIMLILLK